MLIPVASYLIASLVFAAVFFMLAARFRTADIHPPEHPVAISLIGGLAWPLVLVGLLQLGAIALVKNRLSAGQRPVAAYGRPSSAARAPGWTYSHA